MKKFVTKRAGRAERCVLRESRARLWKETYLAVWSCRRNLPLMAVGPARSAHPLATPLFEYPRLRNSSLRWSKRRRSTTELLESVVSFSKAASAEPGEKGEKTPAQLGRVSFWDSEHDSDRQQWEYARKSSWAASRTTAAPWFNDHDPIMNECMVESRPTRTQQGMFSCCVTCIFSCSYVSPLVPVANPSRGRHVHISLEAYDLRETIMRPERLSGSWRDALPVSSSTNKASPYAQTKVQAQGKPDRKRERVGLLCSVTNAKFGPKQKMKRAKSPRNVEGQWWHHARMSRLIGERFSGQPLWAFSGCIPAAQWISVGYDKESMSRPLKWFATRFVWLSSKVVASSWIK